jgi:hypothetical protein
MVQIPAAALEGPYVVLDTYVVNDASGNNNQEADFGEAFSLHVTLKNVGADPGVAITATLTGTDEYLTITDGSAVDFGNIANGETGNTATVNNAFTLSVADNVPNQYQASFVMEVTDGTNSWESGLKIKVNAPVLEYGTLTIDDTNGGNGNGILDPGETAKVTIKLSNAGHADASAVVAELTTTGTELTIVNSPASVATLAAGAIASLEYTVTANATTPLGTPVNLMASATAGEYGADKTYEIIVGFVPEYCVSGATSAWSSDLTGFTFGPLVNITEPGGTYDDFTQVPELVHEYVVGETYDVSVTLGDANNTSYTKGGKVFVDWNYDGDFDDPGETVFTVTPKKDNWTAEGTITIPEDAPLGQKFLRVVVMETGSLDNIQPCGTYSWGGTEDYRIILVGTTRMVNFVVVDHNSEPVEGAEILLTGYGTKTTNAQGLATFSEVEAAQGIIYSVTYNGFKTAKGTVNVEDIDVTVNVMLNPTGTQVNLSDEVRLYPNPFSSLLTLEGVAHVRQVEVVNLIGQRMMLMESNGEQTLTLHTENLQAGVYLIRLTGEDGSQSIVKVVKQ